MRITRARLLPALSPGAPPGLVDVDLRDDLIASVRPSEGASDGDLDADGATLLPGLWDAHVHFSTHALISAAFPIAPPASRRDVLALVSREAASRDGKPVLLGHGFRYGGWGQRPTAADLDAVDTAPVVLLAGDLHAVWANSAGLAFLRAPVESDGLLLEGDAFRAITAILAHLPAVVDAAVSDAAESCRARGIVGIVDMEMGDALAQWERRAGRAPLPLRVSAATYPDGLEGWISRGLRSGDGVAPLLSAGPLKLIADGSMSSLTAQCSHAYPLPLTGFPHGRANYTDAELDTLLERAASAGISAAVHAIGDLAAARVVSAMTRTGVRGTIEHAQYLQAHTIADMARLGVGASIQPAHLLDDRHVIDRIWPAAGPAAFPWRSLADAGVSLTLGSDAPVAPLDPWLAMSAAVHRDHHPDQALSPLEALRASTRSVVAPDSPADLVLVSASVEQLLRGQFDDVAVLACMVAGCLSGQ